MTVSLETERLILRRPIAADIPHFVPLISEYDIAKNLSRVPHPYTEKDAQAFIGTLVPSGWDSGEDYALAILRKTDGAYIGTCGLHPARKWECGYWIGKPHWGQGYATEALGALLHFAFEELKTDIVRAEWFHDNPASGRVLEKSGFVPAGEAMSNCLARGHTVPSHVVALDRAAYMTRRRAS